jgi:hypothetical protein
VLIGYGDVWGDFDERTRVWTVDAKLFDDIRRECLRVSIEDGSPWWEADIVNIAGPGAVTVKVMQEINPIGIVRASAETSVESLEPKHRCYRCGKGFLTADVWLHHEETCDKPSLNRSAKHD